MLDKEIVTNNITQQATELDYRFESVKLALDLLKNVGKKRFKKEFFDEMKEIADNIGIYLKFGVTMEEMEQSLNIPIVTYPNKEALEQDE